MKWLPAVVLLAMPSLAPGHGAEYLGAKLSWTTRGAAQLEISTDYGDNPLLADEAEARSALTQSLEIQTPAGWQPLQNLAPFTWEKRAQPDRSSPLPTDETGKPHQILTALWAWTPITESKELQFRGHPQLIQSLVFWLHEPGTDPEKTRWSMILSGDTTPPITIPRTSTTAWEIISYVLLSIIALMTLNEARRLRR